MFLRKNKELTRPSNYRRIVSMIQTAETPEKLLDEYFKPEILKEVELMKSRDKTEIESLYLKRKDFLTKHKTK